MPGRKPLPTAAASGGKETEKWTNMESKAEKNFLGRLIDWVLGFCGWDISAYRGS
jgi:hypothetical protein